MKLDVLKPCDLLCQVEGHMAPPCQCVVLQVPCHSQLLYHWPTLSCDCTAHPSPVSTPAPHQTAQAAPVSITGKGCTKPKPCSLTRRAARVCRSATLGLQEHVRRYGPPKGQCGAMAEPCSADFEQDAGLHQDCSAMDAVAKTGRAGAWRLWHIA